MRRLLFLAFLTKSAWANVTFVAVDPVSHEHLKGYFTIETVEGVRGQKIRDGRTLEVPLEGSILVQQTQQQDGLPVKEITIRVTASRLPPKKKSAGATSATVRTNDDIKKFGSGGGNDSKQLTKGQAGVAEDSAGQAHVRGEHGEIAFVVDGVPLPDTLSGRQGSVVVTSTIQSLEMITGGFAPEFGGQTAAVLNITTKSDVKKRDTEWTTNGGSFGAFGSELMTGGPLGTRSSYVLDFTGSATNNGQEPNQPDNQTAHNQLRSWGAFANYKSKPNDRDGWDFTFSNNADRGQIPNRVGLPGSYASAGQGYGLFGLRNADGTRPDVNSSNAGTLGSGKIVLASQDAAGQDINQNEVARFSTLTYRHKPKTNDTLQVSVTMLHSQQDVTNGNTELPLNNLPVDSSIEFNPTALRSVDHNQLSTTYESKQGAHTLKAGLLADFQKGSESYHIAPGSQLALDALAALAPSLAPAGTASTQKDVNGNPIYTATGPVPTLNTKRQGYYKAVYVQDTFLSGKLTANYGLRADFYHQSQNLGLGQTTAQMVSPRVNLQYKLNATTDINGSFNRLFNTPPLAQGAVLGQTIRPETLTQFDLAVTRKLPHNQTVSLGYYAKDISDQVDTGLLIPGSQIGLYSAVNFGTGGVHGIEFSYNIASSGGKGWDGYFNFSRSSARPGGVDSTGAPSPDFNDHDQTNTAGLGAAYTFKSGASLATSVQWGSGLASSVVPPSTGRTPRGQIDLHFSSGPQLFHGSGTLSIDVNNIMDERTVINFQSGFSGTRFQQGRSVVLSLNLKF